MGQTKATTINYLKNLRMLFDLVGNQFCYQDETFPKGFDGLPLNEVLIKIKVVASQLGHIYRRTTKENPQQLFERKVDEGLSMPEYGKLAESMEAILESIPDQLDRISTAFGREGKLSVRSERNSDARSKEVSYRLPDLTGP